MIAKIKRKIVSQGVGNTVRFILNRLYNIYFKSKKIFFLIDLCDFKANHDTAQNKVKVVERKLYSQITNYELKTLLNHGNKDLIDRFKDRMQMGHRLFFLLYDDELAGASWVYTGGDGKFFVVPLTAKEFIILDVFSVDKFRGRGLAKINLTGILELMASEGFARAYISTKEWNFYQNSIRKVGFVDVGRYRIFRPLGKSIVVWSSVKDREFI